MNLHSTVRLILLFVTTAAFAACRKTAPGIGNQSTLLGNWQYQSTTTSQGGGMSLTYYDSTAAKSIYFTQADSVYFHYIRGDENMTLQTTYYFGGDYLGITCVLQNFALKTLTPNTLQYGQRSPEGYFHNYVTYVRQL